MTKEEIQRLYGEAMLEIKIWSARASEYEKQLIEIFNKENESKKQVN